MELAGTRASTYAADELVAAVDRVAEQLRRQGASTAAAGGMAIADMVIEALALVIRVSGREVRELRAQVSTELRRARGGRAAGSRGEEPDGEGRAPHPADGSECSS